MFSRIVSNLRPSAKGTFVSHAMRQVTAPRLGGTMMSIRQFSSRGGSYSSQDRSVLFGVGAVILAYLGLNMMFNKEQTSSGALLEGTLPMRAQSYLRGVYFYVGGGIAISGAAAVAAYRSGMVFRLLNANPWVLMIGSMVACIGGMTLTNATPVENTAQKHLFWGLTMAGFGVLTLSPLGFFPQQILIRAGIYTMGIVTSLSLVAMNTHHETFLHIGGPLMMGLTVLVLSQFVNMLFPATAASSARRMFVSNAINSLALYGGLVIFSGFMLYDTQRMITAAKYGMIGRNPDYIRDSFQVYLNILNIFIRMVQILAFSGNKKK